MYVKKRIMHLKFMMVKNQPKYAMMIKEDCLERDLEEVECYEMIWHQKYDVES